VGLVDLLVWVVDPQKYADEALHRGYLRPLVGHDEVMVVVLNQVDKLAETEVETCLKDLRRLMDADGLATVRILATSATRGDGVARAARARRPGRPGCRERRGRAAAAPLGGVGAGGGLAGRG